VRVESHEREFCEFLRAFNRFQKVGVFAVFEFFENAYWANTIRKFLNVYLKCSWD